MGAVWQALMSVAFIPWYLQYLGDEAFGVVGLAASIQACMTALDLGLRPMMSREMARFAAGTQTDRELRSLLRVVELATYTMALVFTIMVALSATWVSERWLRPQSIPPQDVAQAIRVMALSVGLRFVEGLYLGCLDGFQRQVLSNSLNSLTATVRGLGAVGVLAWWSPTLGAFFAWQAIASTVSLLVVTHVAYRIMPRGVASIRVGLLRLATLWRFAAGTAIGGYLTLILGQADRVLLSHFLELQDYGRYVVAATAASIVRVAVAPVMQAYYPRFSALHATGLPNATVDAFHRASQLVSAISSGTAITLFVFPSEVVYLWTGDPELAASLIPTLRVLATAAMLHMLCIPCYYLRLAIGDTRTWNGVSLLAVVIVVPMMILLVPKFGLVGGATGWLGTTIGFATVGVWLSLSTVPTLSPRSWLVRDVLPPTLGAVVVCGMCKLTSALLVPTGRAETAILLTVTLVGSIATAGLTLHFVRETLRRVLRRLPVATLFHRG